MCWPFTIELADFSEFVENDTFIVHRHGARRLTIEQQCMLRQTRALEESAAAQVRTAEASEDTSRKMSELIELVKNGESNSIAPLFTQGMRQAKF